MVFYQLVGLSLLLRIALWNETLIRTSTRNLQEMTTHQLLLTMLIKPQWQYQARWAHMWANPNPSSSRAAAKVSFWWDDNCSSARNNHALLSNLPKRIKKDSMLLPPSTTNENKKNTLGTSEALRCIFWPFDLRFAFTISSKMWEYKQAFNKSSIQIEFKLLFGFICRGNFPINNYYQMRRTPVVRVKIGQHNLV